MAAPEHDSMGLSSAEIAAMAETSDDEASLRAIADREAPAGTAAAATDDAAAGDDGPDDDDDAQDNGGDATDGAAAQAVLDAAAAAAKPATDVKPDTQAAAADDPAALREEQPFGFTANAPEDAQEQITALNAQKAEAFKKLMDGELSPEAYSATESEVAGKVADIQRQLTISETAARMTTEHAQRSYLGKVNALLDRAAKDEGIDYRKDPKLHAELDRAVKFLAGDSENADKSEQWFLDEGHAMVKARHGLGKPGNAVDKPAADADKGKTGKAPDLSGVPPSLRNAPPAASSDDGGEFAHLDNLKGLALERALAKLNPEQSARYLES